MMSGRAIAYGVLVVALLMPSSRASAQQRDSTGTAAVGVDVFLSAGYGTLRGGASERGAWGPASFGVGLERRVVASGALRLEAFVLNGQGNLGVTGLFAQETKVTVYQAGVGAGYRWYGRRGQFVGVGATFSHVYMCDVDTEGGPGFLGGETVSCDEFADIPIAPAKNVAGLVVSGGITRGAVSIGTRIDAGLQPSAQSAAGEMRLLNIGFLVQYRFRGSQRSVRSTDAITQSPAVVRP